MRRAAGNVLAGLAATLAAATALGACGGPDVTAARVDDAVGPAFAHLYSRQQLLLGRGPAPGASASASCARSGQGPSSTGAGDDWVCQIQLQRTGPSSSYTYELNVKANGCYSADGPPAVVGQKMLTTPGGASRVNPLFEFDGCFDTT